MRSILLVPLLIATTVSAQSDPLLKLVRSNITFESDAPLEHITAANTKATGLIDPVERTFAVRIPIADFKGFNAPLQQEHFNENYMVTRTWPTATFQGRIIEAIDLAVPDNYDVRAKGELIIRGVKHERIIPCRLVVAPDGIRVTTGFDVVLDQHDIRIPRVVQQKIAPVVQVGVDLLFKRTNDAP